jgi:hypothetical protein
MYGDTAHARLLKTGWTWDGASYTKALWGDNVELLLEPQSEPDDPVSIPRMRMRKWVLRVARHASPCIDIATYPNINTAALGCTGVDT